MTVKDLIESLSKMDKEAEILLQVGDEYHDYPFVGIAVVSEEELMFNEYDIRRETWGNIEPHAEKRNAVVLIQEGLA